MNQRLFETIKYALRSTIVLLMILSYCSSMAQRVSFEDPGLTFSFKKPKDWVVVDDGYVIKVSPFMRDTATTYLTMTYFDYPEPISNDEGTHFSVVSIESQAKEEFKDHMWSDEHIEIYEKKVLWKRAMISKDDVLIERRFYDFDLDKKNWEIVTSIPEKDLDLYHKKFIAIIKSFRIENESD